MSSPTIMESISRTVFEARAISGDTTLGGAYFRDNQGLTV